MNSNVISSGVGNGAPGPATPASSQKPAQPVAPPGLFAPNFMNSDAATAVAVMAAATQQMANASRMNGGFAAVQNPGTQRSSVGPAAPAPAGQQGEGAAANNTYIAPNGPQGVNVVQHPQYTLPLPPDALVGALLAGGFQGGPPTTALQGQAHTIGHNVAANNSVHNGQASAALPTSMQPNQASIVAAAAAHAAAAQAAANASSGAMAGSILTNMQHWKVGQIESHINFLRDSNQPIPQPVALLLADARRKEDKRAAKRIANRKSASTSRARKKALVEEMTKTNARLRRQALILSLLPDLVIAINVDGEITFCSGQVERVLRHKVDDLIGQDLSDILIPASRDSLKQLVQELVKAEQAAKKETSGALTTSRPTNAPGKIRASKDEQSSKDKQSSAAATIAGDLSSGGAEVVTDADRSFPMEVVKVQGQENSAENSDLSTSNGGGKSTAPRPSTALSRSASSVGNCADDETPGRTRAVETNGVTPVKSDISSTSGKPLNQTSSDESFSSSSDARNLRKANEALSRNVRWHNEKMLGGSKTKKTKQGHKDDVTGASVTANNADARLSSLQHRADSPVRNRVNKATSQYDEDNISSASSDSLLAAVEKKKPAKNRTENSSEDSGYRESNDESPLEDSLDDTSSSSPNDARHKPLAPTCNICLIRDDLTTIWCEVTSSIRTRSMHEETEAIDEPEGSVSFASAPSKTAQDSSVSKSSNGSNEVTSSSKDQMKELLLCLRPIREGEEKIGESLRFFSKKKNAIDTECQETTMVSTSDGPMTSSTNSSAAGNVPETTSDSAGNNVKREQRPPKKRPLIRDDSLPAPVSTSSLSNNSESKPTKKRKLNDGESSGNADDTEQSVIESLMLMSNK